MSLDFYSLFPVGTKYNSKSEWNVQVIFLFNFTFHFFSEHFTDKVFLFWSSLSLPENLSNSLVLNKLLSSQQSRTLLVYCVFKEYYYDNYLYLTTSMVGNSLAWLLITWDLFVRIINYLLWDNVITIVPLDAAKLCVLFFMKNSASCCPETIVYVYVYGS